MQKFSWKIAIMTAVSAAGMLSGCSDSTPSESTIKRQLAQQYSDCKPLSMEGFEKANGYPQQDGSYVAEISYTLVLKPVDENIGTVRDYMAQREKLARSIQDNQEKRSALKTKLDGMMAECDRAAEVRRGNISGHTGSESDAIADLETQIASYRGRIEELKNRVAFFKNDAAYAARTNPAATARQSPDEPELADLRAKLSAANAALELVKQKGMDDGKRAREEEQASVDAKKSCTGEVDQIYRENYDLFNGDKNLIGLRNDVRRTVRDNFQRQCPHLAIGGVMAGILGADEDDMENYTKTLKRQISGRVRLIKSDNGWVIG